MSAKEKLEALKQRKAKIEQEIAALKSRDAAQERKEDTRLKVLIGAALLADAKINPETAALVQEVAARAITAPRDREFLQGKGWLPDGKNGQPEKEEAGH